MRWIHLMASALLLAVAAMADAQSRGYHLSTNQVVVNARQEWQNWNFPQGTLELSSAGQVRPRRLYRNTNAILDIVDFLRRYPSPAAKGKNPEEIQLLDAVQAGSNREGVLGVLDSDMSTYWEPELLAEEADLASRWWFVVDLGHLTFIKKIVLKFVDQDVGDPFLLFDVLVSDGLSPSGVPGAGTPQFKNVFRSLKPNKDQRIFEIDFQDIPEVRGEGARLVKVVVTRSDFGRGREITSQEYEKLEEAERGPIDYAKLLPDGREALVERAVYEKLEPAQQGAVRHYRREHPRLAELEVWTEGDEIAGDAIRRGGFITSNRNLNVASFLDSDLNTFSFLQFDKPGLEIFLDLGAHFWIDTHRQFYNTTGSATSSSFPSYRVDFSDGSQAPDGSLNWRNAVDREQTQVNGVKTEGNEFALLKARFLRMQWTATGAGASSLAELQLYGRGFQPEASLESDLVRLGGTRNLLSINWEADTPLATRVLIQTRTGNEVGQVFHYYRKDGTEVPQAEYRQLLSFSRGDSIPEEIPGSDWSDWSEPYTDPAGSSISSPSPREFLKIRATLLSEDQDTSAMLKSIHLAFGDPVAQSLVGEVTPTQIDSLGVERSFSMYIRPGFKAGDTGFDEILLTGPIDMKLRFVGLYGGREKDFPEDADLNSLEVTSVSLLPSRQDSLHLALPAIGPKDGIELLRLDFVTALYTTGTTLRTALRNSNAGSEGWQWVNPGDALGRIPSNSTTLLSTAQSKVLLTEVEMRPLAFTPNGDGINDRAVLTFNVVRLSDASPVELTIYDLSGRRMRRFVEQRTLSSGQYAMAWDGLDESGELVPPGIYFARLHINTEISGAGIENRDVLHEVVVVY